MAARRGPRRVDRLAPLVRDVLAEAILRRTRNPELRHASITEVELTGDLRIARVFYVALDDKVPRERLAQAFDRASGYLRHLVGEQVRMRHTPELRFAYDEGPERGRHIESLLAELDIPAPSAPDPSERDASEPHPTPAETEPSLVEPSRDRDE